jgi:GTPase SAR1 family protein
MKTTYQQRFISQYLQKTYCVGGHWPFSSWREIEEELSIEGAKLSSGDILVVDCDESQARISIVSSLAELASVGSNAVLITYDEIERAFNEEHTEWVEL